MPERNPHPLRFGWVYESAPLSEAQIASVKRHAPDALVRE
jgi:hypothetical protein